MKLIKWIVIKLIGDNPLTYSSENYNQDELLDIQATLDAYAHTHTGAKTWDYTIGNVRQVLNRENVIRYEVHYEDV